MKSTSDFPIAITTTSDDRVVLESIARQLVEQKLAACVQISGPIQSVYRWKDEIETANEWQCVIKSTKKRYSQVEASILDLHNYDEPQIVFFELNGGSAGYLNWLRKSVDCDE